jgi:hypothetical protein
LRHAPPSIAGAVVPAGEFSIVIMDMALILD